MEAGRTEQDFDELEKLLGEIPTVTSGNPHSEESSLKSLSLNGSLAAMPVNSYKGPLTEKVQCNGNGRIENAGTKLRDDQSLTSAFGNLNLNGGTVSANFKSSSMNHLVPNMNSSMTGTPFQLLNAVPYGFEESNPRNTGQENSRLQKLHLQEPKPMLMDNFPAALPWAHSMQSLQFLSNMAVPGVEFPLMSDVQPVLPCLHSQQMNIGWRNIEEEQFYRHQQYLYLQQLRNQRFEAQHPNQSNRNLPAKLMNRYLEVPISHQDPFWNNYGFNVTEESVKRFPEKILTRSQGQNTLKTVKPLPNAHVRHSPCFQLDDLSSWNSPLDDFKSSNLRPQLQKCGSLNEINGRVYLMAKDQHGCRLLQRKFSEGTRQDVENIFVEVIAHIVELMTDPFGNYLVQKLLEVCSEEQRIQILRVATRKPGELVRVSCDMHGTRAVQKVIETLKTREQITLVVSNLEPGIVTLMNNINGNHVAQRCLQYLAPEYNGFLFDAAIANCVDLATDRHGCCVLQKCLSHSEGEQRQHLINEIASNALILSQDPYGNYVVQFVFELGLPWAEARLLEQLEGNFGDLAMQKYSSNVVEKCLKCSSEERRALIIGELINNVHLDQVMQDPYGNYVIQAALHQSKGTPHAALVEAIRPHIPMLRTSPYGKKVLSSNCFKK